MKIKKFFLLLFVFLLVLNIAYAEVFREQFTEANISGTVNLPVAYYPYKTENNITYYALRGHVNNIVRLYNSDNLTLKLASQKINDATNHLFYYNLTASPFDFSDLSNFYLTLTVKSDAPGGSIGHVLFKLVNKTDPAHKFDYWFLLWKKGTPGFGGHLYPVRCFIQNASVNNKNEVNSSFQTYTITRETVFENCKYYGSNLSLEKYYLDAVEVGLSPEGASDSSYTDIVLDDLILSTEENELPEFNVTIDTENLCYNNSLEDIPVNFTIDVHDPENDIIYYSLKANENDRYTMTEFRNDETVSKYCRYGFQTRFFLRPLFNIFQIPFFLQPLFDVFGFSGYEWVCSETGVDIEIPNIEMPIINNSCSLTSDKSEFYIDDFVNRNNNIKEMFVLNSGCTEKKEAYFNMDFLLKDFLFATNLYTLKETGNFFLVTFYDDVIKNDIIIQNRFEINESSLFIYNINSSVLNVAWDFLTDETESDGVAETSNTLIGDNNADSIIENAYLIRSPKTMFFSEIKINIDDITGDPENNDFIYDIWICPTDKTSFNSTASLDADCSETKTVIKNNVNLSNVFGGTTGIKSINTTSFKLEAENNYILGFEYVSGGTADGSQDKYKIAIDNNPSSDLQNYFVGGSYYSFLSNSPDIKFIDPSGFIGQINLPENYFSYIGLQYNYNHENNTYNLTLQNKNNVNVTFSDIPAYAMNNEDLLFKTLGIKIFNHDVYIENFFYGGFTLDPEWTTEKPNGVKTSEIGGLNTFDGSTIETTLNFYVTDDIHKDDNEFNFKSVEVNIPECSVFIAPVDIMDTIKPDTKNEHLNNFIEAIRQPYLIFVELGMLETFMFAIKFAVIWVMWNYYKKQTMDMEKDSKDILRHVFQYTFFIVSALYLMLLIEKSWFVTFSVLGLLYFSFEIINILGTHHGDEDKNAVYILAMFTVLLYIWFGLFQITGGVSFGMPEFPSIDFSNPISILTSITGFFVWLFNMVVFTIPDIPVFLSVIVALIRVIGVLSLGIVAYDTLNPLK